MKTWAHLHLPRLRAGVEDVISVKVPGQRIGYASWVELSGAVEFTVSEKGRQRCLREGVRNVHAWVVGDLVGSGSGPRDLVLEGEWGRALYDPWKGGEFVDAESLEPVRSTSHAILVGKHVWYRRNS